MDAYRILSVCVVLFTAYIHGTYGYCKDWTNPPERPVLNLCESGETDVQPNASIYLDSEFGPTFTRIKCSCDINFNSGSGTIHLSYRTAINMDNCGVTFSLGSNVWGCKTQDLDVQAQASNNFTYLKTFEDKMNWFSCLGIRSENYGMKITCYRWEQYFLPNEVVDGVFGSWTDWSDCSVTCDDGSQTRVRLCDNPAPRNGGDECLATNGSMTLEETETRSCSQPDCTGDSVDGGFTLWTPWETCTRTCDGGTRTRTRSCTNPEPQNGGDPCSGSTNQTEECNTNDCPGSPIDGGFTDWTPWSTCSRTCDDGTRTRTRSCTNPEPQSGGEPCTGRASETEMCNTQACPGTGAMSSSTQETPITEASTGKKKSGNLGAIIGGVLGGLCLLILIILLIICIVTRRRKRKEKQRPSSGPRSVRYVSHGDDVTVTENELYHYDGETPSHATNALFVGGIPDTPNSPGYIPHISPGNDDKYAVIMDSNRSKPNSKERPKLDSVTSQDGKADIQGVNGDVRASADTAKLAENYNEDNLGQGVENPAYDENYLAPHDSKDGETKPKTSSASSSSPYDYIDHQKLAEDDAAFENENLAGDYATLPDDTKIEDPENNDRYKRFISSDAEPSPDDGYMKSPKRDQTFEFPDKN